MLYEVITDSAIKAVQDAGIAFSGLNDKGVLTAFGQIELVNTINTQLPSFADSVSGWIKLNYSFFGIDLSVLPTTAFSVITSYSIHYTKLYEAVRVCP